MSGASVKERLPDPTRVRHCNVGGCRTPRPDGMVMCNAHWDRVPEALKKEISAAWRTVRAAAFGSVKRYRALVHEAQRAAAT